MKRGVIDIGNTRIKTATFDEQGQMSEHAFFLTFINAVEWLQERKVTSLMAASVAQAELPPIQGIDTYSLSYKSLLPFENLYQTPETLGVDRIAVMAASAVEFPGKPVLVFDIGTCMTIDFLHPDARYFGGNISPGLDMRWNAMHHFTQRLPLASESNFEDYLGSNTLSAMASGAITGIQYEIEGYMNHFGTMYPDLVVVFCGGNLSHFDKPYKYKIFAAPDFVLRGLYHLLKLNENKS